MGARADLVDLDNPGARGLVQAQRPQSRRHPFRGDGAAVLEDLQQGIQRATRLSAADGTDRRQVTGTVSGGHERLSQACAISRVEHRLHRKAGPGTVVSR